MEYKNPIPVAVALVPVDAGGGQLRLLIVMRNIEPHKGEFALPGGYIDEGESAEVAAARELKQETGLDIPASEFRPFLTRITPNNRLLVFCVAGITFPLDTYCRLQAAKNWDTETLGLELAALGTPLCFPLHQAAANEFFARVARGESI